jgi:hypothetical protein
MKKSLAAIVVIASSIFIIYSCTNDPKTESPEPSTAKTTYGGFESQVKWGEHILLVSACHDCHTPKKMTPQGPVENMDLALAGHMAGSPIPDVNRKEMQDKGLVVTGDLTSWVGPWGISFTANLTSDSTGIGMWKEDQFILAIREGKFKGMATGRALLPPMPWHMYKHMTDDELKALFAYLKSTKPIKNVVPPPVPPATK